MVHEILPTTEELERIEATEFYRKWGFILNGMHEEFKRAIGAAAVDDAIVEVDSDSTIG